MVRFSQNFMPTDALWNDSFSVVFPNLNYLTYSFFKGRHLVFNFSGVTKSVGIDAYFQLFYYSIPYLLFNKKKISPTCMELGNKHTSLSNVPNPPKSNPSITHLCPWGAAFPYFANWILIEVPAGQRNETVSSSQAAICMVFSVLANKPEKTKLIKHLLLLAISPECN